MKYDAEKFLKLNCYKVLDDCEDLSKIQEEALAWIKENNPTLLTNPPKFWNHIDYKHFILKNPTLVRYCLSHKLNIREVSILVVNHKLDVPLHTDQEPIVAKLNIPLMNTEGTYTEWYDVPDLDKIEKVSSPWGDNYHDLSMLDHNKLHKRGSIEMKDKPIIFNGVIPHRVEVGENPKLPRVLIAVCFFNQPIHYLED